MTEQLPSSTQLNMIALLAFSKDYAKTIKGMIGLDLYEDQFGTVASAIHDYLDQYDEPPGTAHIHEVLGLDLTGMKDDENQQVVRAAITAAHETWRGGINSDFVIAQAEHFIKVQTRKRALLRAMELLLQNPGDPETPEKVDVLVKESIHDSLVGAEADMGIMPFDWRTELKFLDPSEASFSTGVVKLDTLGAGPKRKELSVFIALPGMGKSHWLTNLGLRAWNEKYKVLHITLEMSENRVQQRYLQSALAIPTREIPNREMVQLKLDPNGTLSDIEKEAVKYRFSLEDPESDKEIKAFLQQKLELKPSLAKNLIIKEYPSGTLTVPRLESFLESLKNGHGFVPDLLLLDYADLMSIDHDKMRESLDRIYVDLRGLATKRDMAIATASQSNRKGMERGGVSMATLAEHFGKAMTADTVIAYNQTPTEKILGLARLKLEKCRSAEDKFEILINQNYSLCQFVTQSLFHRRDYDDIIERAVDVLGISSYEVERHKQKGTYTDDGGE